MRRRESWPMWPLFDRVHPEQRVARIKSILEEVCKLLGYAQWLDSLYDADRKCVSVPLKTAQNNHRWSRRQVVLSSWELSWKATNKQDLHDRKSSKGIWVRVYVLHGQYNPKLYERLAWLLNQQRKWERSLHWPSHFKKLLWICVSHLPPMSHFDLRTMMIIISSFIILSIAPLLRP